MDYMRTPPPPTVWLAMQVSRQVGVQLTPCTAIGNLFFYVLLIPESTGDRERKHICSARPSAFNATNFSRGTFTG